MLVSNPTVSCKLKEVESVVREVKANNNNNNNTNSNTRSVIQNLYSQMRIHMVCIGFWLYKFWITFQSLSEISYSDE